MTEKWRDINGYDGVYQVSDLGQVRNIQTNKILHPTRLKNERIYVTLSSDGFQKKCTVHSLVGDAFLGECPAGHEIRHKDGDYAHNELSNLEYITRQESQKQFVMADETDTDRKRAALLSRDRVREWPGKTRSGAGQRQAREAS
jgi:hypothetical protein